MKKTFHLFSILLLISAALNFTSCADNSDDDDNVQTETTNEDNDGNDEEDDTEATKNYIGIFSPINDQVTEDFLGRVNIEEDEDIRFQVDILNISQDEITHPQYVHMASRCPSLDRDDLNEDGFIDFSEAQAASGKMLMAIDSDLKNLSEEDFPMSDTAGGYFYDESSTTQDLLNALREPLENPESSLFARLEEDEELELNQRVIIIYGVGADVELPETIATRPNATAQESLPVACSEIEEVEIED